MSLLVCLRRAASVGSTSVRMCRQGRFISNDLYLWSMTVWEKERGREEKGGTEREVRRSRERRREVERGRERGRRRKRERRGTKTRIWCKLG